jgi:uncharacterized protein YhaN
MALSKRNTDSAARRERLQAIVTEITETLDRMREPTERIAALLWEAHHEKLYRETHRTWAAFVSDHWHKSRSSAYEMMERYEKMSAGGQKSLPTRSSLRAAKRANRAEPRYAKSDDPGFGDPNDDYSQEVDPEAREYVPAVVLGASTERRVVMTESGWGDPEEQSSSGQDIDSTITRLADAIDRRLASLPQAEAAVQARILRDRFSEWVAD